MTATMISIPVILSALLACIFAGSSSRFGSATFIPTASAFVTPTSSLQLRPTRQGLYSSSSSSSDDDGDGEGTTTKQPHIVILGGGFGGINAALTLPSLPWSDTKLQPKVTLIDRSERFVFLPLLYELCVEDASLDEVAPTYKSLLDSGTGGGGGFASLSGLPDLSQALQMFSGGEKGEGSEEDEACRAEFLQASVEGIDVQNQRVVYSQSSGDGIVETIDYDALIVATGSEIALDAIPGASTYALPFYTVEQALELKRRLASLDTYLDNRASNEKVNVVVVGGGYSGVELALNLVDRFGDAAADDVQVSLVHRGKQVLEYATEHNRNAGIDRLEASGVNVMTSTSVVEVLQSDEKEGEMKQHQCVLKVSTKSNEGMTEEEEIETTLLLWTAGATPTSDRNYGVRNSVLPRDVMGRILTSPTLNVPEYPNVFAIGDCSRPKKVPYPGTAQVAIQMATVAAWNIYATLTYPNNANDDRQESKLLPFKFLNLGEMMTLGTDDATISTLGGLVELNGPAASWLRRWIYAVRMPTAKQGLRAVVDGTGRKLARGAVGSRRRRKSKPVDWK
jgi:NADH:ubiquinone reductase (non-electrogenic)